MNVNAIKPESEKDKESSEHLAALVIVVVFFFSLNAMRWLTKLGVPGFQGGPSDTRLLIGYIIWIIPTFVTLLFMYRFNTTRVMGELGLRADAARAITIAFIATIPMLVGYYFISGKSEFNSSILIKESLLPGIFEEYMFRGFLIGQLFKPGRLGFIPAVLIGSFAFAAGHLYQGGDFWVISGIFVITFLGGAWFAWLFIEWGRNLYLVMALHIFMNLWWSIFSAGQNALGGAEVNIFRAMTVAITVIYTIILGRRTGFKIRRHDWLFPPKRESQRKRPILNLPRKQ